MMITLKIHSVIDVITNSSTEIFIVYENSVKDINELLQEILTLLNIKNKVSDLFEVKGGYNQDLYYNYIEDEELEGCEELLDGDALKDLLENVALGRIDKLEWMFDAEESEDNLRYSEISIIPKDKKYNKLCEKIKCLLHNLNTEEYCG